MSAGGLFAAKVAFAVAVAGVGLTGTLLPWVLRGRGGSERALALSDTLAAGVLGGAGLLHLLGDGMANFRSALPSFSYPLALLLAGAGFLLILFIEGVVVAGAPGGASLHAEAEAHAPPRSPALQHETTWHPDQPRAASPAILLVVLSVHSVILGLALGAQDTLSGAAVIFAAIVAHKGAAGFALGVGYQRAGYDRRRALPQVSFFSLMTPMGIVVGAAVGAVLSGRPALLFQAVFDSLGAGTFLYIAALDILKTEFDSPTHHGQKWLAAVLGFGIMAVLAIWV